MSMTLTGNLFSGIWGLWLLLTLKKEVDSRVPVGLVADVSHDVLDLHTLGSCVAPTDSIMALFFFFFWLSLHFLEETVDFQISSFLFLIVQLFLSKVQANKLLRENQWRCVFT